MGRLRVDIRRRSDRNVVLGLSGELDMATARRFRDAVRAVLTRHPAERIDVDAAKLSFMDSFGMRQLLDAQTEARGVGVALSVSNPSPFVEHLLGVSGLAELLLTPADLG